MRNAGLEETQAGIKIAGRNSNNLRSADDTTLMAESEEELTLQAHLSMGFSRQGYRSGLSFPSPGDLPNPGIKPQSPSLKADSLQAEPQGSPRIQEWVTYPFSMGSS